jgi:nitric oxide reductase activation protein
LKCTCHINGQGKKTTAGPHRVDAQKEDQSLNRAPAAEGLPYGNETIIQDAYDKAYDEVDRRRKCGQEDKAYEIIIKDHERRIDLLKERIEKLRAEVKDTRADARDSSASLRAAMGTIDTLIRKRKFIEDNEETNEAKKPVRQGQGVTINLSD